MKIEDQVRKECSNFIRAVNPTVPLYRGSSGDDFDEFLKRNIRTNRTPTDMGEAQTQFFNLMIDRKFGIEKTRNRCLFVSTWWAEAKKYGYPKFIFPTNECTYIVLPINDSLHLMRTRLSQVSTTRFHMDIFFPHDSVIYRRIAKELSEDISKKAQSSELVFNIIHYLTQEHRLIDFYKLFGSKDINFAALGLRGLRADLGIETTPEQYVTITKIVSEVWQVNIEAITKRLADWTMEGVIVTKNYSKLNQKRMKDNGNEIMIVGPSYYELLALGEGKRDLEEKFAKVMDQWIKK